MDISSFNTALPYNSANASSNAAGQRPMRAAQESVGNTPTNALNTTPRNDAAREATIPRAPERTNNGERAERDFAERPTTNREPGRQSARETIDAIELRPLVVEANNNPATRAFLDVAQPSRDDFQIIDIYV